MLRSANATPSTFLTSQQSSMLDYRSYCSICLQSSNATPASPFIKNSAALAQIQLEVVTRMFGPKTDKHLRSLNNCRFSLNNCRPPQNLIPRCERFDRLAQHDQNQLTPSTQEWENSGGIRTGPYPPDFAGKPVTTSQN